MTWLRTFATTIVVCVLVAGCGGATDSVDLSTLDVGVYSTAPRDIPNRPSLSDGTVLEAIRMSDAVADTSQVDSPLIYLWQAGPLTDTAHTVRIVGTTAKQILDRNHWVAGYYARYADTPQPQDGMRPPSHVGLSVTLLRFPDDAAARRAATALEGSDGTDLATTIAAPLPKHPEIAARYTPGKGALRLDTPIGPFVLRVLLDAPPERIQSRINDVDAFFDEEVALLRAFNATPIAHIPLLPRDPDNLLARMVATDPTRQPAPSQAFAVYGATGALRDQPPAIREDKLYEKWGVERLAVSGPQRLYQLRDNQAAKDMSARFSTEAAAVGHEIDGDPNVPDTRCFKADVPTFGYTCRMVIDNVYTVIRADTESSVKEMTAAQYALLANR